MMSASPDIAALPSMDDHKIGPGGETFADLKQAVLDTRAELMRTLTDPRCDKRTGAQALLAANQAADMLRAAYTRVGLPYVSP